MKISLKGGINEYQLLNEPPAMPFPEKISQNQQDEPLQQVVSGAYDPSNVYNGVVMTRTEFLRFEFGCTDPRTQDSGQESFRIEILNKLNSLQVHQSSSSPARDWSRGLPQASVLLTFWSRSRMPKDIFRFGIWPVQISRCAHTTPDHLCAITNER